MTLASQADPSWATSWTAKDHETSFHFAFAPEASVHRQGEQTRKETIDVS